jgi:chromosome segregation ATPase
MYSNLRTASCAFAVVLSLVSAVAARPTAELDRFNPDTAALEAEASQLMSEMNALKQEMSALENEAAQLKPLIERFNKVNDWLAQNRQRYERSDNRSIDYYNSIVERQRATLPSLSARKQSYDHAVSTFQSRHNSWRSRVAAHQAKVSRNQAPPVSTGPTNASQASPYSGSARISYDENAPRRR